MTTATEAGAQRNDRKTRAQETLRQLRAPEPGELPRPRRRVLRRPHRHRPRHAAIHLSSVLRPRPAAGACADQGRHRARRYGSDPGRQHAGHAGGALRGADDRRGAEPDQHPPRCAARRLLPRAWRGQAAAGRPRVPCHHRPGAGEARRQAADRHRHRRRRDGGRAELRQRRVRGLHRRGRPGVRLCRPRRTSGTRSACSTPRAPQATPRARSTAIAAPISARSPTR